MSYTIEPKDGVEVYVGAKGHVCIKQLAGGQEQQLIILHADEMPEFFEHLKSVYQEALDFVPEPTETEGGSR